LKLENVDGMLSRSAVAYSKHLCGSATDLTLRCLSNFTNNNGDLMGFVIALCCHQLCTFERYINHKYLNHFGITKHEFDMICVISTWAVCGDSISGNSHWSGLSFELRKQLGYQCKRIIDIGRLRYLQEQGCDCELLYYIDEYTSSENMALVCTWNKRSL
jgi:tRNA:m4X modification enzyme